MPLLERFDNVIQIFLRALGHALHIIGPGRVPVQLGLNQIAVKIGQLETIANTAPEVALTLGQCVD